MANDALMEVVYDRVFGRLRERDARTLLPYQPVVDNGGAWFDVRAYGAVGDGVADDTTKVAAANAAAHAAGGGVVFFPKGIYKMTSGLTITEAVSWVGVGSFNVNLDGPAPSSKPLSLIIWAGAAGGAMLTVAGPVYGIHMESLAFDGANLAARCVVLDRLRFSMVVNCRFARATLNCGWYGTTSAVASDNSMNNSFINTVWERCPIPLYIHGTATANACHTTFINTHIDHSANPGLFLGASDNIAWFQTWLYARSATGSVPYVALNTGGTGYGASGTFIMTGGTFTRAASGTWVAAAGVITALTLSDYGAGYTVAPTGVTFSTATGGVAATATGYMCASQAIYCGGTEMPGGMATTGSFTHVETNGVLVKAGSVYDFYHYDRANGQAAPTIEAGAGALVMASSLDGTTPTISITNRTASAPGIKVMSGGPAVTGSRGGNAALASLLTQLATSGHITDSTSA